MNFYEIIFTGEELSKVVVNNAQNNAPQITSPVSTVAEVAVDQLQANEKLIAGLSFTFYSLIFNFFC